VLDRCLAVRPGEQVMLLTDDGTDGDVVERTISPSIVSASRSEKIGLRRSPGTRAVAPAMLFEDSSAEPSGPISCANASSGWSGGSEPVSSTTRSPASALDRRVSSTLRRSSVCTRR
jgi:hypothetical protein